MGRSDLLKAQLVHTEELEALTGGGAVDVALAARLGEVRTRLRRRLRRHTGRAPGPLRYPDGALDVDFDLQDAGRPLDDGSEVSRVVQIEPPDEAEAVSQWPRDESGTGGRRRPA